jgi:hypothetical protein
MVIPDELTTSNALQPQCFPNKPRKADNAETSKHGLTKEANTFPFRVGTIGAKATMLVELNRKLCAGCSTLVAAATPENGRFELRGSARPC